MALTESEESAFRKQLGEALRRARESRGITQGALAELIDVDPVTMSRFENGRLLPGLVRLLAIADALDMTVASLMSAGSTRAQDEWEEMRGAVTKLSPKDRRMAMSIIRAIVESRSH
jgi:transcriptional regulator with XRE-family HTH domain